MAEHIVGRKNQIRSILLIMALMLVTVSVILKGYSIRELAAVIKEAEPIYLISGLGMMLLYGGCQAMNFYIILRILGSPSPYGYCIEYAYIGNYFGAITPGASGGQPAQVYYMNKDQIHVDISSITIFFMIFTSQIVILLLGGVLACLRSSVVINFASWVHYLLFAGTGVMLSLTAILSALMFSRKIIPYLLYHAYHLGIRVRIIRKPEEMKLKLEHLIISYREKSRMLLRHPELFAKVFLISLVQWVAYCTVSFMVYRSFGHSEYSLFDLMTGQALINIAVAAVPLPGSVGVAEKAFLNVFGQFYSEQELPSAMILNRVINFYLPLFISFTVYLHAHLRITKKNL